MLHTFKSEFLQPLPRNEIRGTIKEPGDRRGIASNIVRGITAVFPAKFR